jgi:signal transduction histidine kinase
VHRRTPGTRTVRDRIRARWGPLLDPATAASTQESLLFAIGLLFAALRLGTLAQMAPSFPVAVSTSPHPPLAVTTWALACASTALVCVTVARTRRPPGVGVAMADTGLTLLMFVLGGAAVAEGDRIGTWIGFQPSWALSVLMATSVVSSRRAWLAAMTVLCAADLWFVLPDPASVNVATVTGNLLTLLVLPVLVRVAFRYATRIAEIADESRARAAELARREEERRAQVAMHNGAAVMALLARDDLSEPVKEALREQAREETQRMRRYLDGGSLAGRGDGWPTTMPARDEETLGELVRRVVAAFPDLRTDTLADLGGHVRVPGAVADDIAAALTSVLLNVRVHADAQRVTVHVDELDGEWTVTVHDDGVGFDVAATSEGVGLAEVVRAQLARHGIVVRIESMVGAGTTVALCAPSPAAGSEEADEA